MKFYGYLLAASSANMLAINAFVIPAQKPQASVALNAFNVGEKTVEKTGTPFGAKATQEAVSMKPRASPDGSIWELGSAMKVQGGSLRTWSIADQAVEQVQVYMKTDGRPMNADIELWQGPDNTPVKLGVYVEDGALRPFSAVLDTPASQNAIAIRNTGYMEFPLDAVLTPEAADAIPRDTKPGRIVQGGAVFTTPFEPSVASVRVCLKTDGRPLNCRIELLQGPNNRKQVMEVYTEDGLQRPFVAIIETPGAGNVVRMQNTATIEYPINAVVEAYRVDAGAAGPDGAFIVN